MKIFLILILYFIITVIPVLLPGQITQTELDLILSLNDSAICKLLDDNHIVAYSKNTKKSTKYQSIILNSDTISGKDGNSIVLSLDEKQEIIEQLKYSDNYIWPDSLFANSISFVLDSLHKTLKYLRLVYEDKPIHDKQRLINTYVFSKPCFIRDNSIAFIGFASVCGHECGFNYVAFYKKTDEKWSLWVLVDYGVF